MKRIRKMLYTAGLTAMMLAVSVAGAFAAETDWNSSVVTVEGTGLPLANAYSPAQSRLMARRAAIVDGYRQLAEAVKGVNVDSETTVENLMVTSDRITTRVNALVKGAKILEEKAISDGGYVVKMQIPLFGVTNSVAGAVMEQPTQVTKFPEPVQGTAPSSSVSVKVDVTTPNQPAAPVVPSAPSVQPQTPSIPTVSKGSGAVIQQVSLPGNKAAGNITGLIVDCQGLGLKPVMSPVIKNSEGTPIYGYKNLDYDKVIANGMAGYTTDISSASRAGSHPMVVRAVALDNHNGNPVISVADANRVLMENAVTKFLEQTNVVFVR